MLGWNQTPVSSAGLSSAIDIFVVNHMQDNQVQEGGSVRQLEVRTTTDDGDDSTITEQWLVPLWFNIEFSNKQERYTILLPTHRNSLINPTRQAPYM